MAFFLPDFCTARSVVTVMVVAQLTALVLILARPGGAGIWTDLVRVSLFLHWIGLSSAAVLCLARAPLARLAAPVAVVVALASLVVVATGLAELSWWTARWTGLGETLVPVAHTEFLVRTSGLSAIVGTIVLRYLWVQNEWRRRVEAEAESRFTALQARIRPHFLFNSMNTIAALTRTDASAAEQAVEDLADLFRASLAGPAQRVTLGEELDICRRYLRIESLRLGERLRTRWEIDALPLNARVPGLLLQPLVENAVYHGVEPCEGAAEIFVGGKLDGSTIELLIRNPLPHPDVTGRHGNRLALDNVEERLTLAFPRGAGLHAHEADGMFVVELQFPYERRDETPGR